MAICSDKVNKTQLFRNEERMGEPYAKKNVLMFPITALVLALVLISQSIVWIKQMSNYGYSNSIVPCVHENQDTWGMKGI